MVSAEQPPKLLIISSPQLPAPEYSHFIVTLLSENPRRYHTFLSSLLEQASTGELHDQLFTVEVPKHYSTTDRSAPPTMPEIFSTIFRREVDLCIELPGERRTMTPNDYTRHVRQAIERERMVHLCNVLDFLMSIPPGPIEVEVHTIDPFAAEYAS